MPCMTPPKSEWRRRFSDEVEDAICAEYDKGTGSAALARQFQSNVSTIYSVLRRGGREPRRAAVARQFTADEQDSIRAWAASGITQSEIARRLGSRQTTISREMARLEVEPNLRRPRGETHGSWKGGQYVLNGYVQVRASSDDPLAWQMRRADGYVTLHRLVMARKLGRPITAAETVHHIDGDKTNNSEDNLQLRTGNHGKGVRYVCRTCGSHDIVSTILGAP